MAAPPTKHLWILGALLVALVALHLAGAFHGRRFGEPFVAQVPSSTLLRCPPDYTFFNDSVGASFCCRGRVNPYTHQCGAVAEDDLCAFVPNAVDPRNKKRALRLCTDITKGVYEDGANYKCPNIMPSFATGSGVSYCCTTGIDEVGSRCVGTDMADKSRYCVAEGKIGEGEQSCAALIMGETAKCPEGQDFQKVNFKLGKREEAQGLTIPTCFRLTDTCIPDEAIAYAQEAGAFKGRDPKTWGWACSNWELRNVKGDQSGEVTFAYP